MSPWTILGLCLCTRASIIVFLGHIPHASGYGRVLR